MCALRPCALGWINPRLMLDKAGSARAADDRDIARTEVNLDETAKRLHIPLLLRYAGL